MKLLVVITLSVITIINLDLCLKPCRVGTLNLREFVLEKFLNFMFKKIWQPCVKLILSTCCQNSKDQTSKAKKQTHIKHFNLDITLNISFNVHRLLVERVFAQYMVPHNLETTERMKCLYYLYATLDTNAVK